jgi:hypothetical protein
MKSNSVLTTYLSRVRAFHPNARLYLVSAILTGAALGVYRLLSALFIRRLKRTLIKDRFQLRLVERAQAELAPLPQPLELVRAS